MNRAQRTAALARVVPVLRVRKRLIRSKLVLWERKNGLNFPWRDRPRTPYRVLVAELLLRRTTANAVRRVYPELVSSYPRIKQLLTADLDRLEDQVAVLGLRKQRRKAFASIIHCAQALGGRLPPTYLELISIPHVGPYAAAAVLSFGRGVPMPIVDSNVERIFRRMFSSCLSGVRPDTTMMRAMAKEILPKESHETFNYGLLDLGALVCKYDKPRCRICPIRDSCDTGQRVVKA